MQCCLDHVMYTRESLLIMENKGFFGNYNTRCLWRQGERITQGISCADVADVCLKALHDPVARNKTFEVRPPCMF